MTMGQQREYFHKFHESQNNDRGNGGHGGRGGGRGNGGRGNGGRGNQHRVHFEEDKDPQEDGEQTMQNGYVHTLCAILSRSMHQRFMLTPTFIMPQLSGRR